MHPVSNRNVVALPESLPGRKQLFHIAGRLMSGSSLEATPYVLGVWDAPVLSECEGVSEVSWAAG